MKVKYLIIILTVCFFSLYLTHTNYAQDLPFSDPDNKGNWILNGDFSDEFQGDSLNMSRWHLQGEFNEGCEGDGCRDGIYYNGFVGRRPAQFTPDNAWVEDGMLILETRWEPDFDFNDSCDNDGYCFGKDMDGTSVPVTTAGVNTLKQFTYGYMEIKSKAADAEITSAFWTIGSGVEIDMFEMFGKYRDKSTANNERKEKELKFNLIEWANGFKPRFDTFLDLGWRVADDFHIYGFEWDDTSVKVYVDGEFKGEYNGSDFFKNMDQGTDWTFTGSQRLWVDQESFPWNGIPNMEDLPAQYQIEYIRVWQKGDQIEDETSPVVSNLDTTSISDRGEVEIYVSEQSKIYMVPEGTAEDQSTIEAADPNPTLLNEGRGIVKTTNYDPNQYVLYAIDGAGNISKATASYTIETSAIITGFQHKRLNVYPNPSASIVRIEGIKNQDFASVKLINTSGQTYVLKMQNGASIDVSTLPVGLYYILVPGNQEPVRFLRANN